jgi:tRNA modification GTPase
VGSLTSEPAFVTTARQAQALETALTHCQAFYQSCKLSSGSVELHAFELYHCAKSLQSIVGEVTNDEILGKVFSDFCIGK